jgi:sec-independent protein translocase protein TatA
MFRSPIADGVIVLVVLLLFFGPKRLPMLSRSIGESIKEFKGGIDHSSSEDKAEITSATQAPTAAPRETVDAGSEHRS